MSQIKSNKEVIRSFINELWNEGDFTAADRFLTSDYVDHAYQPNDVHGLTTMVRALYSAFPDQHSSEDSIIVEGDRVITRLRMTGTHLGNFRGKEATHQPIDVRLYREYRLVDGKIAEHWALLDTATLLRQIGAELKEQPACQIKRA